MKYDQDLCLNLWYDLNMNSTLGSVVPLAMFIFMFEMLKKFQEWIGCRSEAEWFSPERFKSSLMCHLQQNFAPPLKGKNHFKTKTSVEIISGLFSSPLGCCCFYLCLPTPAGPRATNCRDPNNASWHSSQTCVIASLHYSSIIVFWWSIYYVFTFLGPDLIL